jgi:hypothetical protein
MEQNSTEDKADWRLEFESFTEFVYRMLNGRDRYGIDKINERIERNRLVLKDNP